MYVVSVFAICLKHTVKMLQKVRPLLRPIELQFSAECTDPAESLK